MQRLAFLPIALVPAALLTATAGAQIAFQPADTYALQHQRPDWVAVGDFDGVNGPDLAVTVGGLQGANGPEFVEIFQNLGNGTFAAGQQVFVGSNVGVAAAVAADFDGDNDIDLAVSLKNLGTVQLLVNTGGVFAPGGSVAIGGSEPRHMVGADVDGDGDVDLVTANRDSNSLSVLLNNGSGAFSLGSVVPVGADPRYLVVARLNGDLLPDVAVASHDSRRVDVLFNNGAGGFAGMQSYAVPGNNKPTGMVAFDLEGDGDMDLATTTDNNDLGQIVTLRNTGGTFASQVFATGGVNPSAIVAGDFDVDGDQDLAAADEDANRISALANTGAGTFGAATSFPVGAHPTHLEAADFDGNGSLDLATVNRDSDTLMVLLNSAAGGGLGTNFCGPAAPNSTGGPASISASGSTSAAANDVLLSASGMPQNQFGYFLNSPTPGFVQNPPGSSGNLCLMGQIGRYSQQLQSSGAAGQFAIQLDLPNTPRPNGSGAIVAGETWFFQAWFRDQVGGVNTSNFTDGLSITFN
jgi:hypothetical protein